DLILAPCGQRLVGQEGHGASVGPQRGDHLVGAGDQRLPEVHGPVEVEQPPSMRQRDRHRSRSIPAGMVRPHLSSGATAAWARSANGAGMRPRSPSPISAMPSARPPASDGATDSPSPSGSRMYMYTITRR